MGYRKKYIGSDNSDREDFFDDYGNLKITHVERYDLSGNYKRTDVYNEYNQKIDSFKR